MYLISKYLGKTQLEGTPDRLDGGCWKSNVLSSRTADDQRQGMAVGSLPNQKMVIRAFAGCLIDSDYHINHRLFVI